jgi:preprotein translocase SecE subunit
MLSALLLASAMWVASEAKRIGASLPKRTYTMSANITSGTPTPGSILTLLGTAPAGDVAPVIGTGKIQNFDKDSGTLVVGSLEITDKKVGEKDIHGVRVDGVDPATAFRASVSSPTGQEMIEPLYLQGGSAAVVIIIGAILIYWFCAVKPGTVDFLINTDMEMKKVNWSTRKDIIASTYVVIGSAFLIAALIFTVDVALQTLFRAIGVLHA